MLSGDSFNDITSVLVPGRGGNISSKIAAHKISTSGSSPAVCGMLWLPQAGCHTSMS